MGKYCGIDLGVKKSVVCVLECGGQLDDVYELPTTSESIKRVFSRYCKLTCVIEAAPLAEWFSREVEALGHKVMIVCPRQAKAKLSGHSKKKTDRRDARGLAELCRTGWFEEVHRKSQEARALRSFMTARKQLVESGTAIASSVRGILRAHGIKIDVGSDEESFGEKARAAIKALPDTLQYALKALINSYEELHERQRTLYKMLHKLAKTNQVTSRLMTVPGVGAATASAFVATIDDPDRFTSGEHVASYLGLTPSVYQSGETEYRGRITKTGDKLLRWLLVEAAHILLTRAAMPCELKNWGLKLQAAKGTGKARVAVARKLCVLLWKLWKNKTVFHSEPAKCAA